MRLLSCPSSRHSQKCSAKGFGNKASTLNRRKTNPHPMLRPSHLIPWCFLAHSHFSQKEKTGTGKPTHWTPGSKQRGQSSRRGATCSKAMCCKESSTSFLEQRIFLITFISARLSCIQERVERDSSQKSTDLCLWRLIQRWSRAHDRWKN